MDAAPDAAVAPPAPKWRLFLKVLPLTALFALAKCAVHAIGMEPWEFDSLTGSLFGASTFVIAFVLSGTLANYNASEEMLIQLINAVESIEDINRYTASLHANHDGSQLSGQLADLLLKAKQWLTNTAGFDQLEASLSQLNRCLADLRLNSGDSVSDRGLPELARIRILLQKMAINRNTDFLGPAYAMLEIFLVGAVLALLLIGADRFSENLVVSCFLFTSFTYLLLLIKDLDNPFQYDGTSCVEVDLAVLSDCRHRLLADPGSAAQPTIS